MGTMAFRFKNLDGSGPHPFANVFKWGVVDKLARPAEKVSAADRDMLTQMAEPFAKRNKGDT